MTVNFGKNGRIIGLVVVIAVVSTACQTVADPRQDRIFLMPGYVSESVPAAVAQRAAAQVLSVLKASKPEFPSTYHETGLLDTQERERALAAGATALALLDVLVLAGEPGYQVSLRLVDGRGIFASLRAHLTSFDNRAWAALLGSPVPGLARPLVTGLVDTWWRASPVSDPRAVAWQDALVTAHEAGDFEETRRLTDLFASLPLTAPQAKALAALQQELRDSALVVVPGGTFSRGSAAGNADEKPVHPVTVDPFVMARHEVTQGLYQRVMGTNPSLFSQLPLAGARPVERVTWFQAVEFCNKLSVREGLLPVYTLTKTTVTQDLTRNGYRLPTEAEWEWAAREARSTKPTLFSGGDKPLLLAWTDSHTKAPEPVGTKAPNALGLYDLSGNVWEWCWDWYGKYPTVAQTNPGGPEAGVLKVGRGGSWRAAAWNARVTSRSFDNPSSRANVLGFRVVRSVPLTSPAAAK